MSILTSWRVIWVAATLAFLIAFVAIGLPAKVAAEPSLAFQMRFVSSFVVAGACWLTLALARNFLIIREGRN